MKPKKPTSFESRGAGASSLRPAQPFVYRPAPGWPVHPSAEPASPAAELSSAQTAAAFATSIVEEIQADLSSPDGGLHDAEKKAWDAGFQEGLEKARAENEASLLLQKDAVAGALREFARERNEYFHQVEGEVVALALAIVRKILRRESQLDPLLLSGLVRVALEKMAVTRNVRLRVHPSQISVWQDFLNHAADLPLIPELMGDSTLEPNQCCLETDHGSTDLNLETQLKEIEQGLFDLLAQRPSPR
ncbi:MAG TPA: FliH/SctL family protein [Verrucomicrobiae bacterium]|nr:FliH/SctL family protein [Verrucomicrobiae bacterium]